MFEKLTLEQKLKVSFEMGSPNQVAPDIQKLIREYRECLMKDYEIQGGYTEVEGAPEDAVFVIEHE